MNTGYSYPEFIYREDVYLGRNTLEEKFQEEKPKLQSREPPLICLITKGYLNVPKGNPATPVVLHWKRRPGALPTHYCKR